jgi:hypothetical protein
LIQAAHEALQIGLAQDRDFRALLIGVDECLRRHDGLAAPREWRRLGNDRRFGISNRQVSMGYGDCRDLHVAADHHCPGSFVDDHARRRVRLHQKLSDLGDEANRQPIGAAIV